MDLLNRLIADIIQVTETLIHCDQEDLATYQAEPSNSVEKKHGSKGVTHQNRDQAQRPMRDGVHRSVC
jgi:glutamate decarboxylase